MNRFFDRAPRVGAWPGALWISIRCALFLFVSGAAFAQETGGAAGHAAEQAGAEHYVPGTIWVFPFIGILLSIAVLPLIPKVADWWHHNSNKLMLALGLAAVTLAYYALRGHGYHEFAAGLPSVGGVINHAVLQDYIPFIVLLFSLYTISGGILVQTSMAPTPLNNTLFLLVGASLASFIGTTGASMLFIRPLLQINKNRRYKKHTVVFFIFLVSNIGGALLPIGDPPLFLGYLYGVPFLWTLRLFPEWLLCAVLLSVTYFIFDSVKFRNEERREEILATREPFRVSLSGAVNLALLAAVILVVATLSPGRKFPGTEWIIPKIYLREILQLGLAGLSIWITPKAIREANNFNFAAIGEVACLFIGIFITMQTPMEILQAKGPELGLNSAAQFFWASGLLSSVLDNAPTYVVFFTAASSLHGTGEFLTGVTAASGQIPVNLLTAVSLGSVFMGANTYIGNGPNFMVKSIAEQYHVRMPGFFAYMIYSGAFLIPAFILITLIFFR